MLLSMTGYGRHQSTFQGKSIMAELRSLNSKFTDLRLKLPQNYREKEGDIRKLITERVERGKIDFTLEVKSVYGDEAQTLNVPLFKKYYQELSKLTSELGIPSGDFLQSILRMPNIVAGEEGDLTGEEWSAVYETILQAIEKFDAYRSTEGGSIEEDMRIRIRIIQDLADQLPVFEAERLQKMRTRLYQNLEEFLGRENIDENRFEQEVLFYLEKMDITEEKVRLSQHCKYYLEELDQKKTLKGRKLSFISQEIGREINTLGAKAYSSDIQRLVVGMKDELEKIKEQVANSL